jgi:hypothetical protein
MEEDFQNSYMEYILDGTAIDFLFLNKMKKFNPRMDRVETANRLLCLMGKSAEQPVKAKELKGIIANCFEYIRNDITDKHERAEFLQRVIGVCTNKCDILTLHTLNIMRREINTNNFGIVKNFDAVRLESLNKVLWSFLNFHIENNESLKSLYCEASIKAGVLRGVKMHKSMIALSLDIIAKAPFKNFNERIVFAYKFTTMLSDDLMKSGK